SLFVEVLPVAGHGGAAAGAQERAQASLTDLRVLKLPENPMLEAPAAAFAESYTKLSDDLFQEGFAPVLARHESLLGDVRNLLERQFEIVRKGLEEADPARARKPAGRAQGGFLFQARKLVAAYEEETLPSQAKSLQATLNVFVEGLGKLASDAPERLEITGDADAFAPTSRDGRAVRAFKRRRRFWATVRRGAPSYTVPLASLQSWYVYVSAADLLEQWLRSVQSSSHRLAVQLGKILNEAATELSALAVKIDRREAEPALIEARKQRLLSHVDAAVTLAQDLAEGTGVRLARRVHDTSQAFADDLKRIDVKHLIRTERRRPRKAPARLETLRLSADPWEHHQRLLLQRAHLGLQIAAFQHRFSALAHRARTEVTQGIKSSVLNDGLQIHEAIGEFLREAQAGRAPTLPAERELRASFDGQAVLETIARDTDGCIEDLPESATTLSDESIAALESGVSVEADEVTVSVRPLVKFLIETEFLDVVNQEISGLPLQEQRTVGVARDVLRLLSFTVGDMEAAGGWQNQDFRKQVVAVAREGARRLDTELGVLRNAEQTFSSRVAEQLGTLRDETAPYALTNRSDSLSHYIRSRESHKAVSRVRRVVSRAAGYARQTFVALLYRRSTGVLLARRLRRTATGTGATVVDRIAELAQSLTPRRDLLRALPFYYRQLFSGQATISETFWVGRQAELARIKAAIKRHENGGQGALFIVGETGAGKTALCHVLTTKFLARRKVFRVSPPPGGAIEPAALRLALEAEVGDRGKPDELLNTVPDGSVFVFDDLELWWERSPRGMALLEEFIRLLGKHGDRCLFVANLNVHAWRFMSSFARLSESALAVVECDPLPAETLKSIISLRHGSTGISFELAGTPEEELAPWRQARLFTRYFDFSGGLVAVALRAWLSHIDKVDANTLIMRWPTRPRAETIGQLRVELSALLVQLVVHKQVTMRRLQRITSVPPDNLEVDISALARMGLVRRDARDIVHVDRFVAHLVTDSLRGQGMLR
ncbi:MAG: ATP-binding protein, partial [Nannocystaceae bacterium]|nr:ATP-binding protein [Nannocystaceae bacterium]